LIRAAVVATDDRKSRERSPRIHRDCAERSDGAPCGYQGVVEQRYLASPELALFTMSPSTEIDPVEALVPEIERYLRIVEYFRSEGCEPQWAREDGLSVRSASEVGSGSPAVGAETA
jgi:hypothetical protein